MNSPSHGTGGAASSPHNEKAPAAGGMGTFLKDIARYFLIALLIVVPLRAYVAQPFYVVGSSMDPTFTSGEYLIIDELSYQFRDPRRGEVVVFRFPKQPSIFFIKRIIGLPGETVEIRGNKVLIHSATSTYTLTLEEPYVAQEHQKQDYLVVHLGDDEYFVLGDNREASLDSRAWGPLSRRYIIGRVLVRLFPFSRIAWLPGAAPLHQQQEP